MASIKFKRNTTNDDPASTLNHGEIAFTKNIMFYGNSNNEPIPVAEALQEATLTLNDFDHFDWGGGSVDYMIKEPLINNTVYTLDLSNQSFNSTDTVVIAFQQYDGSVITNMPYLDNVFIKIFLNNITVKPATLIIAYASDGDQALSVLLDNNVAVTPTFYITQIRINSGMGVAINGSDIGSNTKVAITITPAKIEILCNNYYL